MDKLTELIRKLYESFPDFPLAAGVVISDEVTKLLDQQKEHYETLFENEHLGAQADIEEALKAQKISFRTGLLEVLKLIPNELDIKTKKRPLDPIMEFLTVLETPIEGKDEDLPEPQDENYDPADPKAGH